MTGDIARTCRYDPEHGYLTRRHWPACKDTDCPGCLPCTHDEDGTEIRHCIAREGCTGHLEPTQALTCSRCIARAKGNIRKIKNLSVQMLPEAMQRGLRHPSADLAAPAADPRNIEERRIQIKNHVWALLDGAKLDKALAAIPDEDDWHPYAVLGRWEMMLREDYGQPTVLKTTIPRSADYLLTVIDRFAQDPDQDFAQLAGDLARVSGTLDGVIANSKRREKGAPCWLCDKETAKPLVRHYGHWCDDEECDREHPPCPPGCTEDHGEERHDFGDWWGCQTVMGHWWPDHEYQTVVNATGEHRGRRLIA